MSHYYRAGNRGNAANRRQEGLQFEEADLQTIVDYDVGENENAKPFKTDVVVLAVIRAPDPTRTSGGRNIITVLQVMSTVAGSDATAEIFGFQTAGIECGLLGRTIFDKGPQLITSLQIFKKSGGVISLGRTLAYTLLSSFDIESRQEQVTSINERRILHFEKRSMRTCPLPICRMYPDRDGFCAKHPSAQLDTYSQTTVVLGNEENITCGVLLPVGNVVPPTWGRIKIVGFAGVESYIVVDGKKNTADGEPPKKVTKKKQPKGEQLDDTIEGGSGLKH